MFAPPDLWIAFPLGHALAGAARTLIRTLGATINAPRLPFRARIDFCPSNLSSLWVAAWLSSHDSRKKTSVERVEGGERETERGRRGALFISLH